MVSVTHLLTTEGRQSAPFKLRVSMAFATIALLHVVGFTLLAINEFTAQATAVTLAMAVFAYFRGLIHSFDFDHISMIDNSTRKFVAEGRNPASVGLAFSAGHSTVVILTGILVVAGARFVHVALDAESNAARILGIVGLSVSGLYLILVACTNIAYFLRAWQLRRQVEADPSFELSKDALTPRGPASRVLTAPLRRVKHPRHIYFIGFLFSLGFDTSSQIGLMMLTGAAAVAGAPPIGLLALPFLFAGAMTLGDTCNGLMMLRMYQAASSNPLRRINFNLLITGISIFSALAVGLLAASTLLSEQLGVAGGLIGWITSLNTDYAGYLLAATFAVIGIAAFLRWRVMGRALP